MVQIFAYFKDVQILQKLEATKSFVQDDETTPFFLTRQLFIHYGAPNAHVNTVAMYHHLDGQRSMHHESKSSD